SPATSWRRRWPAGRATGGRSPCCAWGIPYGFAAIGLCQGVFGLFTMYLPPLFPTLLRTTGAGFCYNIGRIVAGLGTVFFGLFSREGDPRLGLFYAAFLCLPAAGIALRLPDPPDEKTLEPTNKGTDEACY